MNIRDLARLAGVSPSTVSKVINGKDDSISAATRERVLNLVKEYNYQAYSAAMDSGSKSFILGVLLKSFEQCGDFLEGFSRQAQLMGYSIIPRFSGEDPVLEEKNLAILTSHHIDGLIWEPVGEESLRHLPALAREEIPVYLYNAPHADSFRLGLESFGYAMTDALVKLGHSHIACVDSDAERFLEGYRKCLFENHILADPSLVYREPSNALLQKIVSHDISAVITASYSTGIEMYRAAGERNISIPTELSLLTLCAQSDPVEALGSLSAVPVPMADYGSYLCHRLVREIEKQEGDFPEFVPEISITGNGSLGVPYRELPRRILVVGSINIDNYLKMDKLPRTGKTVVSSSTAFHPGGKALNEAVGLAKLGFRTSVIGCVGSDSDSGVVFDTLNQYHINRAGVRRVIGEKTGQAYIFVQKDGESMITIMSGANAHLSGEDVAEMAPLFEDAAFCLIQTEIPMETVIQACRMAKDHEIPTILKPSACGPLPPELLQKVDIIAPNREELNEICPDIQGIDEQADFLLRQGVGTVVVTLGAKGCYIRKDGQSRYFPAVTFPVFDASGAADAFLSALTAYLYRGVEISKAVEIANYAAGYSVSKEGVIPSLISRQELDGYVQSLSRKNG